MNEKVERFEDLWIWAEARKLVNDIYADFREGPGSKDFGYRNQIQSAGISVMNNAAEGFERKTDADFARFLDIAKGSCGEVRSMFYIAEDQRYVSPDIAELRRSHARQSSSAIRNLSSHLRSS